MGKISKSIVRTGVAYKRGEKRTEKVKEQKQKQKGSIKRTEREQRETEKRERKKGTQNRRCHRSLPKRRSIKKPQARVKEIAKKYQIEGSIKMKTNRKRKDGIVIEYKGEADRIEQQEKRKESITYLKRKQ